MRWRWVEFERYLAPSSSGLGHHPLKVAARVRIPLGLPIASCYALFPVAEQFADIGRSPGTGYFESLLLKLTT